MLQIVEALSDICYSQIMKVYAQSNLRYGNATYPRLSQSLRELSAEQDFYAYLRDFFRTSRAMYALWVVEGEYKSALRLEPYEDGFLLAGLETAPDARNKGFAKALVRGTLDAVWKRYSQPVYSHIEKTNLPSLAVHRSCGFSCIREDADYIDGTHRTDAGTWIWKK